MVTTQTDRQALSALAHDYVHIVQTISSLRVIFDQMRKQLSDKEQVQMQLEDNLSRVLDRGTTLVLDEAGYVIVFDETGVVRLLPLTKLDA